MKLRDGFCAYVSLSFFQTSIYGKGIGLKRLKNIVYGAICIFGLSGCATFKSLNAEVPLYERVFLYNGTRLDWATLENDNETIRKFKTEAPSYPLVDLPFSFAMDTVFLPLAISAEIFH